MVTASDSDGEGVKSMAVDGPINLTKAVFYTLTIGLINELAAPIDENFNITHEVQEGNDEHQFFFSWKLANSNPGNGNVDNRTDPVNGLGGPDSKDVNNRPLAFNHDLDTVKR